MRVPIQSELRKKWCIANIGCQTFFELKYIEGPGPGILRYGIHPNRMPSHPSGLLEIHDLMYNLVVCIASSKNLP